MTEYIFNTNEGTLSGFPQEEDFPTHRANKRVSVMSSKEFKIISENYPHCDSLLSDVENIKHCRLDAFSNCILGTIKTPTFPYDENPQQTFGFYLGKDEIIFISDNQEINSIFLRLEKHTFGKSSLVKFFLGVLEYLIRNDSIYLQNIEDELSKLEESLLSTIPQNFYEDILRYRKILSKLHAYYDQLTDLGQDMEENFSGILSPEECALWQVYTNRTERLHNHTERLIEYLLQIRELYQSQLAAQQNKVITFLTVVTTIFLPLTLIAGWYGINFSNMLAFKWNYGYLAVIILSVIIIAAEIIYFKKKKML